MEWVYWLIYVGDGTRDIFWRDAFETDGNWYELQ